MQGAIGRIVRWSLWVALALVSVPLQGLAVFAWRGYGGPFLSLTGLYCTLAPVGVELVLAVVVLSKLDEVHSRAVANPHSPLGQALRNDALRPRSPPRTGEAWKGEFEDMDEASDRMSRKDH